MKEDEALNLIEREEQKDSFCMSKRFMLAKSLKLRNRS